MSKSFIESNLLKVRSEIANACKIIGINPSQITLLAVSKTHPSEMIRWASECGQIDFGENYVQEAVGKQKELSLLGLHWHFIGQLQRNKVKSVVGAFDLIHSVDSMALAEKISQRAEALQIQQKILLEVNVGEESSKAGFTVDELQNTFESLLALPGLCLAGVMTLPPLLDTPEEARPYFRKVRNLFYELKNRLPESRQKNWLHLSMGTTNDFVVAIEEGANIIRIGTAIFGEREKTKFTH